MDTVRNKGADPYYLWVWVKIIDAINCPKFHRPRLCVGSVMGMIQITLGDISTLRQPEKVRKSQLSLELT
jgi:hypothetical protein